MENFTLSGKPAEIIDQLTYISYREQRRLAPQIKPERWRVVFGFTASQLLKYEAIYQAERRKN